MSARRLDQGGITAGVVFVLIGLAVLLDELDVWALRLNYVLPLVLIGIGASILVSWFAQASRDDPDRER